MLTASRMGLKLVPELGPSVQQIRTKKKDYRKTLWGPNYAFRRGQFFVGTNPHPLKYFSIPTKKPSEPYGLQGTIHLIPEKGKIAARLPIQMHLNKDKVYAWCMCGYSHNQPLCDGSHARENTKCRPVRYIPEKDMDVWFCCCKQTKNRPFCDGTHESLPPPPPPPDRPPKLS